MRLGNRADEFSPNDQARRCDLQLGRLGETTYSFALDFTEIYAPQAFTIRRWIRYSTSFHRRRRTAITALCGVVNR